MLKVPSDIQDEVASRATVSIEGLRWGLDDPDYVFPVCSAQIEMVRALRDDTDVARRYLVTVRDARLHRRIVEGEVTGFPWRDSAPSILLRDCLNAVELIPAKGRNLLP